jgi:hypothetical protein
MLDEQMEGCALSKGELLCYQKRIYISRPLFLGFLIFLSFSIFLKDLKKNKRMLCYKGGMSVAGKKTSSKRKEHANAQSKETCARKGHSWKIPPWVKVSSCRGKVIQGLPIRHASKVQLRSK